MLVLFVLFSYIPKLILIFFLLQMTSSAFDNQETDVQMQCEDQEYQETFADANATSGASSQAMKAKKLVVPRSTVWEQFTRTKENRNKCICHHCEKVFSCASKSGTSNLKQHLQICKEHQAWLTRNKKNQQQVGNGGNLKASKVTEALFREACNEMVVVAELPLSFIESTGFKNFCDKVQHFFLIFFCFFKSSNLLTFIMSYFCNLVLQSSIFLLFSSFKLQG